ncbi:MAG: fibrobacter succinogenes major paralogous domain-containing protein [Dysgonamonadaceae bacterium]|jgi:uncharacterized protein (TIGR02145 family)|nr:fibrobacter succinogenes major paralogous domain-containing protein [Dysgonamonadaceae bacterium]
MKKIFLTMTAFFMLNALGASAQVTIGSLDSPQDFSILELVSNETGGLRLPQLTAAQREALELSSDFNAEKTGKAMGLQIFNTTTLCVETWNGAEWIQACICPPSVTDGQNTYSVGYFGAAGCWMTENLRSTRYSDGTALTVGSASNSTPDKFDLKYYNYPTEGTGAPTSVKFEAHPEYGLLYTWAAASGRTGVTVEDTEGVELTPGTTQYQGICPTGWHLPSDYEWNMLEKEIANANNTTYKYGEGNTDAWNDDWGLTYNEEWDLMPEYRGAHGLVMMSQTAVVGTSIASPQGQSNIRSNNGFDALLVGSVASNRAASYGSQAEFWSSSSGESPNYPWIREFYKGSATVGRRQSRVSFALLSVRCKKD